MFQTRHLYLEYLPKRSSHILVSLLLVLSNVLPAFQAIGQTKVNRGIIVRELDLHKEISALEEDHHGFMWVGTTSGLYRFDGYEFLPIGSHFLPGLDIDNAVIYQVYEDHLSHLWILSAKGIFILSDDRTRLIPYDPLPPLNKPFFRHQFVYESGNKFLLCNFSPYLIWYEWANDSMYQFKSMDSVSMSAAQFPALLPNGDIMVHNISAAQFGMIRRNGEQVILPVPAGTICFQNKDKKHLLAFGFKGISEVDPATLQLRHRLSLGNIFIPPMRYWISPSIKRPSSSWIGGQFGQLVLYNASSNSFQDFSGTLSDRLFDGRFFGATTGLEDEDGGFWLGTTLGLAYVQLRDEEFFNVLPYPEEVGRSKLFSTRGMAQLPNGNLLLGSYPGTFEFQYDPQAKGNPKWVAVNRLSITVSYTFLLDKYRLLAGTEGGGVTWIADYNPDDTSWKTGEISSVPNSPNKEAGYVFALYRDSHGTTWAGTADGLYVASGSLELTRYPGLESISADIKKIFAFTEDENKTIWIAAITGLYSLSRDRQKLEIHAMPQLNNAGVQAILKTGHTLWLGTRGSGLIKFDAQKGIQKIYSQEQGLSNNIICAMQLAADGSIWISTHMGLSRFDPNIELFTNFYMTEGLPDNEFNHGSSFQSPDGTLFFGGINGVVYFDPLDQKFMTTSSHIRVSRVVIQNGKTGQNEQVLYSNPKEVSIRLGPLDKFFSVTYSLDDPAPRPPGAYGYRLVGFHTEWQNNGTNNTISFTGLQAGQYTLQIKSLTQSDEEKALLEIPVFIARPFYQEWWAYSLYVIAFIGIAFFILREYFKRLHSDRQLQLETEHKERLLDINRSKSTFFTNITHEFKTPLTLIQGPAEEIARSSKEPDTVKQANLISKSAKSILTLVNQLLALGKLEANLEQPQFYRLDIVQYLQRWMEAFVPLARQKEIRFGFETENTAVYLDFDPVKLETVFNNLFSNALKFTPEKGKVKCAVRTDVQTQMVQISLEDNGPGIAPEEQEIIFERFYQGKNSVLGGTGIGLAFVREMVRIHKGQVQLQSQPGHGATFVVSLPFFQQSNIHPEHPETTSESTRIETSSPSISDNSHFTTQAERPVIVLAEDHEDVAQLILDVLGPTYQIFYAPNGRDAYKIALEQIPDLILTDVMMPIMDGYSFTHLIRQDIHTSHIPVIMLTAKDGEMSRIEGRSSGADVYLQKPFSIQELQLCVRNLVQLKNRIAEKASQQLEKNAAEVEFGSEADSTFYHDFLKILEENLSESSLSVDDFTTRLAISRTQLHRKLKAITGLSVNQIIRNVRLQRGMALIRKGNMTISEIAYEVGFSNPAYFTERFKEFYGYPPSEVDKNPIPGPSS